MRIGELAVEAGGNAQTIRFYERQDLLPPAARTPAGYRSYSARDIERIAFIRRSQQLGFSLNEIKQLMQLHNTVAPMSKREARAILLIAQQKVAVVGEKIALLTRMRRDLSAMVAKLRNANTKICPVPPINPRR